MKSNAIIRIIIYSILILLIVSIFAGVFLVRRHILGESGGNSVVAGSKVTVPGTSVKKLNIEWVAGTITIKQGDTQDIAFSESSRNVKAKEMVWSQSGDTLTIQYSRSTITIGIAGLNTTPPKDLVITVPAGWDCRELEIESVSTDLIVADIACERITVENVSGKCDLKNFSANKISLETVSGDATISGSFEALDIEAVSADCQVYSYGTPKKIDLNGVSGDLDLHFEKEVGFTYSADSLEEDFYSDFPTTSRGDRRVYGDGSCIISADCVSGSVSIWKGK